jgi:hypothetical protein
MFHVHGDDNRRHNLSGAPMLDPLTGLLFLLGLVFVFRAAPRESAVAGIAGGEARRRTPGTRGGDGWDPSLAALLVSWLLVMLLPNILSVEGVPHGLRSCGVLPAVALLGGIGLEAVHSSVRRRAGKRLAAGTAIACILLIGCWTGYRYFVVWGSDPQVARDHDGAYRAAARVLLGAPPGTRLLLVANGGGFPAYGYPVEAQVYLFDMRDRPPAILGPKDSARLILNGDPAVVALIRRDDRIVEILRRLNPGASVVEVQAPGVVPESPVYRVN